jgi:hypothetical protein
MTSNNVEAAKAVGDTLSLVTVVGTLTQILPAVAALFTIIWTAMRIIEMITGKDFSVVIGWVKNNAVDKE